MGGSITTTLIEHWNGSSWSVVASPSPSRLGNSLSSVSAISSNDVWAVGTANGSSYSSFLTLVEHWDGSTWSVIPSPSTGGWGSFLFSVAAISDSNIWAVGEILNGASNSSTLVEHWDGSIWSIVSAPSPGQEGILNSVAAISAINVWAVGSYLGSVGSTLAENWNGNSWNVVASPNPSNGNGLNGVAAPSASDASFLAA